MRVLLSIVLMVATVSPLFSQTKKVCFSIDDLPVVSYGISDTIAQGDIMHKLIQSLNKNNIPAIGFVNEMKLYDAKSNPIVFQIHLLNHWVNSNLELGNHTFSHPDYNSTPMKTFGENILQGELFTRKILNQKGDTLKYFRHPFLHAGNSKAKSDSLNSFLSQHNYIVAPVTIDNEDYLFALAYKRAKDKNDNVLMTKIGKDYIDYMENKVKHFEKQATKIFGRDINQILLIHASALNADYTESLAKMFIKNNYTFITMDEALKDKAYETEVTAFGNWGISWLDRWALSQGKKGDFFKGEPETPDYIKALAK